MVSQSQDGTDPFGFCKDFSGSKMDDLGHCALMSWEEGANSHADYKDRGGSNNI